MKTHEDSRPELRDTQGHQKLAESIGPTLLMLLFWASSLHSSYPVRVSLWAFLQKPQQEKKTDDTPSHSKHPLSSCQVTFLLRWSQQSGVKRLWHAAGHSFLPGLMRLVSLGSIFSSTSRTSLSHSPFICVPSSGQAHCCQSVWPWFPTFLVTLACVFPV